MIISQLIAQPAAVQQLAYSDVQPRGPAAPAASSSVNGYDAVVKLLDLTHAPRNLVGMLSQLGDGDLQEFLTITAKLLQSGVVGTETYDLHGEPYYRFIETTLGDPRLRGLGQYRDRTSAASRRLDLRA